MTVPEERVAQIPSIMPPEGNTQTNVPVADSPRTAPWSLFSHRQRWRFLTVLFLVATSNFFDKNVISVLLEPIKQEFRVSDMMLGLLSGFCFAIFYALFGMPVARWADRGNRRTVITLALMVWSVMTMFCGVAQTFWQLALARVGVGAGESGAIAPAHSLIADYFPPERRATPIGIFTAAGTAGYLLGFGLGGYITATYGWRAAFLLAGAPGLALALVVRVTLPEPRLQLGFPGASAPVETARETLTKLRRKRSYLYALAGCLLYTFVFQGALIFIPSFLIRVQHASLADVSMTYGGVAAVASAIGTLVGGWLADRLSQRDIRWLGWLPAISCILATPLYMLAFSTDDYWMFIALAFVAYLLLTAALPGIFAAIHAVCGTRRRAMAIAIMYFSATLFGSGFGPLVTGAISDALSPVYGADGLRYSLMAVVTVLIAAASAFYRCSRVMPSNLED